MEMTKHLSKLHLMLMSYSIVVDSYVYMSLTIIHTDKNHSMSSLPLEAFIFNLCFYISRNYVYMSNTDFKKFRKCNKE